MFSRLTTTFWRSSSDCALFVSRYCVSASSLAFTFAVAFVELGVDPVEHLPGVVQPEVEILRGVFLGQRVGGQRGEVGVGVAVDDVHQPGLGHGCARTRPRGTPTRATASCVSSSGTAGAAACRVGFETSARIHEDADARACLINVIGSRGFGRVPVEVGMLLELQFQHDPPPELAARQDLFLRAVVRRRLLPVARIVHAEVADRRAPLVLDLNPGRRLVHRDRRVGLHHHRGDDEDEGGAGHAAVLEDGVEAVQEMDRLPAAGRRQRHGRHVVPGQGPRSKLLGIEHLRGVRRRY